MIDNKCHACGRPIPRELANSILSGIACCDLCGWSYGKCYNGVKNKKPCSGYLITNYPNGIKCIACNRIWKDTNEYDELLVIESGRTLQLD